VAGAAQVVNLAHLSSLIRNSTERFTKLELEWNKVGGVSCRCNTLPRAARFAFFSVA
jgi:hypothetical protein